MELTSPLEHSGIQNSILGCHGGECSYCCLLGWWQNMLSPSSGLCEWGEDVTTLYVGEIIQMVSLRGSGIQSCLGQ
jgi:hypothetical protein